MHSTLRPRLVPDVVLIVGANHRGATAAQLGGIVRASDRLKERLRGGAPCGAFRFVRELTVLGTCNRVETYFVAEPETEGAVVEAIRSEIFCCDSMGSPAVIYERSGVDAAT